MNSMNGPMSSNTMGPMSGANSNMAMSMNQANTMPTNMSQMNMSMGMNGKSMSTPISNMNMNGPQSVNGYPGNNINGSSPRGRPSPYPSPHQYINQKRGFPVNSTYNSGPGPGAMQNSGSYVQGPGSQYPNNNQVS